LLLLLSKNKKEVIKMDIERKMRQISKEFPEAKKYLEDYRYEGYSRTDGRVNDLDFKKTKDYLIVAAIWKEDHDDSLYLKRIEWRQWVSLYYKNLEQKGKVQKIESRHLKTRHGEYPEYDLIDIWPFEYVRITKADGNKVIVHQCRKGKLSGIRHEFDLKHKETEPYGIKKYVSQQETSVIGGIFGPLW
jgi:hypothetical protein